MSGEFLHVTVTSQGLPEAKEEANSIWQFEHWAVFWCGVDLAIPWQILRAIGDGLQGDITALVFRAVCFWREDTPSPFFFWEAMPAYSCLLPSVCQEKLKLWVHLKQKPHKGRTAAKIAIHVISRKNICDYSQVKWLHTDDSNLLEIRSAGASRENCSFFSLYPCAQSIPFLKCVDDRLSYQRTRNINVYLNWRKNSLY